jgi:predicted GNAT superfamily acetyltransferase
MNFTIRDLQSYNEMVAVRQVQREVWGFAEPDIGLYPPVLLTAAKNGGVVLGAFDDESGEMVAFLFSFLGREAGGPLKLCSQNMGVKKEWRKRGIAEALKRAQRERAAAQGLPLITWTYDPLEGPNAHLNLRKLRAISRTYWRDVYGSNFGTLNAGLPSDRLLVEWWVNGPRLEEEPDDDYEEMVWDSPAIFETQGEGAARWIVKANLGLDSEFVLLETPADIHPVKEANIELALDWRLKVRKAFESYFGKGYLAVDFVSVLERGERRNRYVLQKSSPELLVEIGIE